MAKDEIRCVKQVFGTRNAVSDLYMRSWVLICADFVLSSCVIDVVRHNQIVLNSHLDTTGKP